MLVTIFSDAGLCDMTGSASWGGWAKSARGTARGGGILRDGVRCTAVAETRAITNAIYLALREGVAHPGDRLIIQTDNIGVQSIIKGKAPSKKSKNVRHRNATKVAFDALIAKHGLTFEWRHVKGHNANGAERSQVNIYCDRVAGYYLSVARHEHDPAAWPVTKDVPYGIAPRHEAQPA